jgi:hypothetical protein
MAQLYLYPAEQGPRVNDYIAEALMSAVLILSAILLLAQFAA